MPAGGSDRSGPRLPTLIATVLALGAAIGGCGATPSPSETPPAAAPTLYKCRDDALAFPIAALIGNEAPLVAPPGAVAALEKEIGEPGNGWLPPAGWRAIATDGRRIEFGAVDAEGGPGVSMTEVTVAPEGDAWRVTSSTQCLPILVLPGLQPARWWLDPAHPPPGPDATVLHVILKESACTGGQPPFGRLAPIVTMTQGEALIVIGVRPLANAGCGVDEPAVPWQVTLPEPLGNRRVLDGSVWPPLVPDVSGPRGG